MTTFTDALKTAVQNVFSKVGVNISMLHNSEYASFVRALRKFDVNVVFDIGANDGEFASDLRRSGYTGKIICFEPLPDAHHRLCHRMSRDPNTIVHPRSAVGSKDDIMTINVSKNSVSSSLLELLPEAISAAPESAYVDKVETDVCAIDTVIKQYVSDTDKLFVKVDTQGYEWEVLNGAEQSIGSTVGWLLELSLLPLYKNQHLWSDFLNRLEQKGFSLWKILPVFSDPVSERTLQIDGVFFNAAYMLTGEK